MAGGTPITTPSAPSSLPDAPVIPVSQPTPDLSSLIAPAQQPNLATAVQNTIAPYVQKEQAASQRAEELANTPTAAPNVPHARLLSMVQGLALGLSAFGTAIATHGQEGGAKEVAEVQAVQNQDKIAAQQAAQAQKNAQIQQQLMVADTNEKLAQNVLFMATLPNTIAEGDLKVQQGQQAVKAGAQDLAKTAADFQSTYGVTPDEFNALTQGGSSVSPKTQQNFSQYAAQRIGAATKVLKSDDPYLLGAQKVINDPNASAGDIFNAIAAVNREVGFQAASDQEKLRQEQAQAGSIYAKLSAPEALSQPGAQAAINAAIEDPNTDPADLPKLKALIPKAAIAQSNLVEQKRRQDQAQQLVAQGDSDDAGKMLADRTMTLQDLKLRNATPAFMIKAVKAAQKYDKNFNAAQSENEAKIAASAANQQFFGNTDSLLVNGGTLDQLQQAFKNLGNQQLPPVNSLENVRKAALGQGPQAAIAAAILGVADDYSKVMSGGQGSDTSREQAIEIINKNLSPEGVVASTSQIRKQVESQRNGRIGTNPYLKLMYPDPTTLQEVPGQAGAQKPNPIPSGATGQAPDSTGKMWYHDASGKALSPVYGG